MKKIIICLTICAFAMLFVSYSSAKRKMNDAEMIYNDVCEVNMELGRLIYAGDVVIGDEIADENGFPYFYVEEELYTDVSDVDALMRRVFTDNYIEQNLGWVLVYKNPLYKNINGKLCVAMKDAQGGDIGKIREVVRFDEDELEIITQNDYEKLKIYLCKEEDVWLIDSIEGSEK